MSSNTATVEVKPEVAQTPAASGQAPEVKVSKPTKAEVRRRLKLARQAAKLNLSAARVETVAGEAAQVLQSIRESLNPPVVELHGTWGYVAYGKVAPGDSDIERLTTEGFYFSQQRHAFRRPGLGGESGKGKSMDEIRKTWGCREF